MSSTAVFKCLICGNTDSRFIGTRNKKPYCRKWITFNGENAKERKIKKAGGSQPIGTNNVTTSIDDGKSKTLTHKSHSSSKSIKSKHKKKDKKNGINTLINAVCESPKTRNT